MQITSGFRLARATLKRGLAVAAAAFALTIVGPLVTPVAAQETGYPEPVWSGLDTRTWEAPIPEPGRSATVTQLDPSISLPGAGEAVRQVYGTIDQHGRNAISTSAVFLPEGEPPAGGWPVIAWAHGTTGLGDDCAPSTLPRSPRDADYLGHWLDRGYAIVASDYVGLGTPGLMSYLNGETTARGIVDSVIAAHDTDLPLSERWALVGQSQGGGAALNTAARVSELTGDAALDYRGVVATGAPANIELILQLAGPGFPPFTLPTGLNTYFFYILAGFREARPDLNLDSILSPFGREMTDRAETLCYFDMREIAEGVNVGDAFTAPLQSIPDVYRHLNDYMGTPTSGYDRPVFLGQGLLDMDVPAPSALSLAAEMTANGQPLELHVYPDQDHSGTVYAATPDATAFLDRVMG